MTPTVLQSARRWWRRRQKKSRKRETPLRIECLEDRHLLAVLEWTGDIPPNTVWGGSDIHRVTGNVRVPTGSTLTVQPGAIVKFNFSFNLTVEGTLQALGQSQQPIVFTEMRDDVGGDTNGDGTNSTPGPGNWGHIHVSPGATANIDHAQIRFGGAAGSVGQVTVDGGSLTLTNSSVTRSAVDGVRVVKSDPTMTDNVYQDNGGAAISMDLSSNPAVDGATVSGNAINGLQVDAGTLTEDGNWNDPDVAYWLDDDITVPAGLTLTIGAGQIVKFGFFGADLFVNGTLDARGTTAQPITFTEARDDTAGGDTNGNGTFSTPGPGNWGMIEFTDSSTGSVMDHVHVRFGGSSGDGQITVANSELTLTNSTISRSAVDGVRIVGSNPTLTNNIFSNNSAAVSMDLASSPAISGVTITDNAINGLQVDAGTIAGEAFWNDPDIVYWLNNDITVPEGSKLTIAPGQIVKFGFFGADLFVNGTLDARGTTAQPITFTEARDDTAGGDTNGNGTFSTPGPGNWGAIEFTDSSTGSVMDHVHVRFGGSSGDGQITVTNSELTLTNSTISRSAVDGVRIVGSNPTLTNNTFSNNSAAVSMDLASNPAISGVTVTDNAINGLQVDAGTIAGNVFWNDPDIVYWLNNTITVPAGSKLTIAPGQITKFGFFQASLIVDGTLDARGSAAQPILFTEARDDSAGGDTNGNGTFSVPGPGNWGRIEFTDTSADSVLDHVIARFGGSSGGGQILVTNSEPTIRNSTISSSGAAGVRMVGGNPLLTNNHFSNNVGPALSTDLLSDSTVLGSTFSNNTVNGLSVDGGSLTANTLWNDPEVVYWLTGAVTIPAGLTLTIAPGQIIKGVFLNSGFLVDGQLLAEGTAEQPIIITSRDDDTAGGDTNNNGPVSIGLEDWAGIEIRAGSTGSVLDHMDLRYTDGSLGATGMVRVVSGQATLMNSMLRNCAGLGAVARTTGNLTLLSNQIINCGDTAVVAESGGTITAINNTIDGSTRGVLARTGSTVNLRNNLITNHANAGVVAENLGTVTAVFNDVFNPGRTNYFGLADQTGSNGNISVDPKYFNRENRQFQLTSGSPVIDAGTSDGAPTTDAAGNARFDDPNVPNTGGGVTPFFDIGARERQEISVSDIDLATISVTGPATGNAGDTVQVNWTVKNLGAGTAAAPWSDAVYLSRDTTFSLDDKFLGRLQHTGDLSPGQSYDAALNVTLNGVQPGPNFLIVRTNDLNDVFEGAAVANNAAAAATAIDFAVATLTLGAPFADQFVSAGQSRFYAVTVPAGQTLNVLLDSAASGGVTELYIRRGSVPSRSQFDFRSASAGPDQNLVVPTTGPGTYFILAFANSGAAATSAFTLTAALAGLEAVAVTPSSGSNSGRVTIAVQGTGLSYDTQVSLIAPDNSTISAVATQFVDASQVYATFDLAGRATGTYGVRVSDGLVTDTLPGAFVVTTGNPGHLTTRLVAPDRVRVGFTGSVTVEYINDGGADLVAPFLLIQADHANLRLADQSIFGGSTLAFLGINSSGPAGVLPPGAKGSVEVVFLPTSNDKINFSVGQLEPNIPLDWPAAKDDLRPVDVAPGAWDAIFANFTASVGDTGAEFQAALARDATYLSQFGQYVHDIGRLQAFELALAGGFGTLSNRYTLGALGRGLPDPANVSATTEPDGSVTVRAAGQRRVFLQRNGKFHGADGDNGQLSIVNGAYRLREPDGRITRFRTDGSVDFIEDNHGNRVNSVYTAGRLTALTDNFGNQTTFSYNAAGRINQITDPVGHVTTLTYDAAGEHLLTIGNGEDTIGFTYVIGQGAAREHAVASVTYADGRQRRFEYDAQGRVTRESFGDGDEVINYSYEPFGGVTVTDASGATITNFFNEFGQIGLSEDSRNGVTSFFYDAIGRLNQVIDPAGQSTHFTYDSTGNATSITDPQGNQINATFSDALGRLLSLRDPLGHTLNLGLNTDGDPTSMTYPDGSALRFTYDSLGRFNQLTDRGGNSVQFEYDAKNLITSQQFSDGLRIDYTYDARRNLKTITDDSGTTTFTYDTSDQITQVAYPNGRSLAFEYDAGGRRSRMTDQTGFSFHYSYDALGRLSEVTRDPSIRMVAYTYDAVGRLAREDFGNGTFTTYGYDTGDKVQSIVHHGPDNSVQSSFAYTYDSLGRVATMSTLAGTATYGYDAIGQLTSASLPGGRQITYQYDTAGNRVRVTDTAAAPENYAVNNLNQYTSAGAATFVYDSAGNLISRMDENGTTTYSYDARGRMTAVNSPTEQFAFEYDAFGNRTAVTRNGVRTEYLVDPFGLGNVAAEFGPGGQLIARYANANGLIGRIDAAGDASFYGFDAVGNTAQLSGPDGSVLKTYSYLPFGEIASQTGAAPNPFTFAGQAGVMDDGAGLYYMRHRYYDRELGRFTSPDPASLASQDLNFYRYAGNQPTLFGDPDGLIKTIIGRVAAGATRAIIGAIGALPQLRPFAATLGDVAAVFRTNLLTADLYPAFELGTSAAIVGGVVIIGALSGLDTANKSPGQFLQDAFPVAFVPPAITGALGSASWLGAWFASGSVSTTGTALAVGAGTFFSATGILLSAGTGYLVGYGIRQFSGDNGFINLAVQGGSGIIIRTFLPPETVDYGKRGKILIEASNKLCGDLDLSSQGEECFKRLVEAGISQVNPVDPNDIGGPAGFGSQRFVTPDITFPYTILFENKPDAAAAAVQVKITQQLDADLDWTTFEVGDFGFGDLRVEVPAGLRFYSTRVDYTAERGEFVDVTAGIDLSTGIASWTFTSIDPKTGEPATDVDAGFLPPNITRPEGDGFANYKILARPGLTTATTVNALASIVFDTNAPLDTPLFVNTIDAGLPASSVSTLPAQSPLTFNLSWSGTDDASGPPGSGIASYDVFVSDDGGPFTLFQDNTTQTTAQFTGIEGHTYRFYSVATDNVGHVEGTPAVPDTETKLVGKPWQNARNNRDVTDDGNVVPIDVLVVINEINGRNFSDPTTGKLNDRPANATFYFDVNGDTFATSNDALVIINFLNAQVGEGESDSEVLLAGRWVLNPQLEPFLLAASLKSDSSGNTVEASVDKSDAVANRLRLVERPADFEDFAINSDQDFLLHGDMEEIQDLDEDAWDELLSTLCFDVL